MLKVMQAHMVVMTVPFLQLEVPHKLLSVWIGMIENWFWIGLQGHTSTKEPIRIPSCSFTEGYPVVPVLVQGG